MPAITALVTFVASVAAEVGAGLAVAGAAEGAGAFGMAALGEGAGAALAGEGFMGALAGGAMDTAGLLGLGEAGAGMALAGEFGAAAGGLGGLAAGAGLADLGAGLAGDAILGGAETLGASGVNEAALGMGITDTASAGALGTEAGLGGMSEFAPNAFNVATPGMDAIASSGLAEGSLAGEYGATAPGFNMGGAGSTLGGSGVTEAGFSNPTDARLGAGTQASPTGTPSPSLLDKAGSYLTDPKTLLGLGGQGVQMYENIKNQKAQQAMINAYMQQESGNRQAAVDAFQNTDVTQTPGYKENMDAVYKKLLAQDAMSGRLSNPINRQAALTRAMSDYDLKYRQGLVDAYRTPNNAGSALAASGANLKSTYSNPINTGLGMISKGL